MPSRTAIFTVCSNNYIPQAEVFFDSVRASHPTADLYLGLADELAIDAPVPRGVTVIPADQLDIPDFRVLAFRYDIMEFNTAIKPYLFLRLFERGYDRVVYFDPDIMVFRHLDIVFDALDRGASFVLTPHLCSPPYAGAPRDELDVMRTGTYNLGFMACGQRPETEPTLRWWARKLRYQCFDDQPAGLFVDQKFMDLLPGFTDHAKVLRDSSLNVAYWNIAQRAVGRDGAGWTIDGRPLGFFHFSGFDPAQPARLSKHVKGTPMPEPLQSLLDHYATLRNAAAGRTARPYAYGRFMSGTPIPPAARRMFRETHRAWPDDPFATYEAFCRKPSPDATLGGAGEVVTNLMRYIHSRSPELRGKFDLGNRFHVSAFRLWFEQDARESGVSEKLV